MRLLRTLFQHRVGALLRGPAPTVEAGSACASVLERMRAEGLDAVVVTDPQGRALGLVTDAELRRRGTSIGATDCPVGQLMRPVTPVRAEQPLVWLLARLARARHRHAVVVDSRGRSLGVVAMDAADGSWATLSGLPLHRLVFGPDREQMRASKAEQPGVVAALLGAGVAPLEVQALLGDWNRALHEAAVALALREMEEAGRGAPPANFEVIAMGSVGRGECLLAPDQDNGMIMADVPAGERASVDAWFGQMAGIMTAVLERVGFARCPGDVMATQPLWRKFQDDWRRQVLGWVAQREGRPLRLCDIFFDYHPVAGSGRLCAGLHERIRDAATHAHFLRALYHVDEEHGVALDLLGRLRADPLEGPHRGELQLKLTGMLPLVGAVRILALRAGLAPASTLERMARLGAAGVLDADEHEALVDAFCQLTRLLLRRQSHDLAHGRRPSHHVPPESLSRLQQERLIQGLRAIRELRRWLRRELTGGP